jgi:hypothetical protein
MKAKSHELKGFTESLKLAAFPLFFFFLPTAAHGQFGLDGFDRNAKGPIRVTADQPESKIVDGGDFFPFGGAGTWSVTGSLANGRYDHTATLLSNGKVLVAGGQSNSGPSASAELYDPASGTWSATGDLPSSRQEHTAVLLPDGRVLVAGGTGGSNYTPLATAELYDPSGGTWSTTGSIATPRINHTMTLLPNGKVLIAGGLLFSSVLNSAELYDPVSGTWSGTGSLAVARYYHTATLLPNGKVLVAGGYNSDADGYQASAELYDPASGTWSPTGPLAVARRYHTATLLPNGKVLVAGGQGNGDDARRAELYDAASGTWSTTGSLITARIFHATTLLPTGLVLVAGGFAHVPLSSAELYDPESGSWSVTGSLPVGRYSHTLTLQPNGTVLSAGGTSATTFALDRADLYDIGPLPTPGILGNISTRLRVETGENVLIGGFIVTGTQPKRVIVRAIGPSLPVAGALADPILELRDSSGVLIRSNDNWRSDQETEIIATTIPPSNDLESAIVAILPANNSAYTAVVRGVNDGTGVGLIEAYDLDRTVNSKLANISTRGLVQTEENVLIAGTIVLGQAPQRVLVRAIGPSLPVSGKLEDPTLELRDGDGTLIRSNDNWRSDQEAEIIATTIPPSNDLESALIEVLPGNGAAYTAIVRGVNNSTGVGLVEVYALD